ncbi:hypothetical protein [Streptomyces sp. NBC_00728]|uniref:hypothetical protein n=1 Tax=Streptomyces sp. NBC_00728 TaxID=2903676 RepID=UPI003870DC8F
MTAGATEPVVRGERASGDEYGDDASRWAARPGCVVTADGTYGARLARHGESWYPERWTLDGPEPYAVPLPGPQPEEPGTEVLPLTDGRVLIHRVDDGRHAFSLLYPTGPGTGELPLGAVECPDAGTVLRLLPPAPDGERAYALAVGRGSTAVWLVAGGPFGPEHLAEVPGHCSGGVWLDGTGRLLALDRFQNGRTKTVVVDLERGGEVSPLLQIAEHSNDRLLLADADSGLLLIRSDAPSPGRDRLGWGVLGSTLPVRFPDCLTATGCSITPFAIQPGQVLTPETCAVGLRLDGPGGTWVGLWRPSERRIHHRPAPEGWLPGIGLWTTEGVLRLPYATGTVRCGVARLEAPVGAWEPDTGDPAPTERPARRPMPLQQAPLKSRPADPPHPAPRTGPPRPLQVRLALRPATARPPRDEAVHAVDGIGASPAAGTGPVPVGPDTMSTVTSLVARTSPAEARWTGSHPGDEPAGAAPPVVRLTTEKAEPLRPLSPTAPEASGPPRPQPSRWTRVTGTPTPEPGPRTEVARTPTTEPDLWTKVAETPPPGMSLRTRADGTLPGSMSIGISPETAEPLPPTGGLDAGADPGPQAVAGVGAEADAGPQAGAGTDAGVGAWAGVGTGTGTDAGVGGNAPVEAFPPVAGHGARTAGPLPAVTGPGRSTAEPLPPVASPGPGPGPETAEPPTPEPNPWARTAEALTTEPGLWTKVAETPPPGMSLGSRAVGTFPTGPAFGSEHGSGNGRERGNGNGSADALHALGEFRGQVALRPAVSPPGSATEPASALAAHPQAPVRAPMLSAIPQPPAQHQETAGAGAVTHPARRPLHAGPLPPAGPVSGSKTVVPAGGTGATAHTDGEKKDNTGEETSPSDVRAMTAR